jgi:phosphate uptake regulator
MPAANELAVLPACEADTTVPLPLIVALCQLLFGLCLAGAVLIKGIVADNYERLADKAVDIAEAAVRGSEVAVSCTEQTVQRANTLLDRIEYHHLAKNNKSTDISPRRSQRSRSGK